VSGLKSSSFPKKPYHRPTCTQKSITEVGTLVRKKTSHFESRLGAGQNSPRVQVPILLVEGFRDGLRFIGQTTRTPAHQLEPFSILKSEGWIEMQFADPLNAAMPEAFLVLDLRHRRYRERGLLESLGGVPDLGVAFWVILVSSMEQFHGWSGIEASHCWQLRGSPSGEELAAALRWFLHWCTVLAKCPPEESPALEISDNFALIGKANKE
jgi:hypothetical protein